MAHANWMPLAKLDLEEILFYIAVDDARPGVARTIGQQFHEKCELLAQSPFLGEARTELGKDLRLFSFRRWAIVYRPSSTGIDVIGIVDASRDFGEFFRNR